MKGFGPYLSGMGSKVYLIEHLAADELYHRYREEQDAVKRTHLQILWLLMSGRPAKVAAEMTGYSQRWTAFLSDGTTRPGLTGWAICAASTPAPCSTPIAWSVLTTRSMIPRPMAACGPAVWSRNGSDRPPSFTATRLGILAAPGVHPSGAASAPCPGRLCRPGAVQGRFPRPHGRADARGAGPVGAGLR